MNIAEILKYCPKGTKLYCTLCGNAELGEITNIGTIVIRKVADAISTSYTLDYEGRYSHSGECVLFPSKDQRDWNKFRFPVKRGDIMMEVNGKFAFIANGKFDEHNWPIFICGVNGRGTFLTNDKEENFGWTTNFYIPASEEAKKELFDTMAEAGYRWNASTLELEKLEPKFKEGDVVVDDQGNLCLVSKIRDDGFIIIAAALYTNNVLNIFTSNTVLRSMQLVSTVSTTDRDKLYSALVRKGYKYDKEQHLLIKQEFKPFDKVLIRDEDNQTWRVCLFSHYRKDLSCPYVCVGCSAYKQCIPYEGNEYLLGTTDSPM